MQIEVVVRGRGADEYSQFRAPGRVAETKALRANHLHLRPQSLMQCPSRNVQAYEHYSVGVGSARHKR